MSQISRKAETPGGGVNNMLEIDVWVRIPREHDRMGRRKIVVSALGS